MSCCVEQRLFNGLLVARIMMGLLYNRGDVLPLNYQFDVPVWGVPLLKHRTRQQAE
jgi:hypothetical protein